MSMLTGETYRSFPELFKSDQPASLESDPIKRDVLREMPSKDGKFTVTVVGPDDYRVAQAIDIETENFASLGDDEAEARQELQDTTNASFILISPGSRDKVGFDEADVVGVIRYTKTTEGTKNKTIADVAILEKQEYGEMMDHLFDDMDAGHTDPTSIIDITSMAIRQDVRETDPKTHARVANNLQYAISEEVLGEYAAGNATHCTAFIQVNALDWLIKWGQPFEQFNGYSTMDYDTYGTGVKMKATPVWLSLETLRRHIENRMTSRVGKIALPAALQPVVEAA